MKHQLFILSLFVGIFATSVARAQGLPGLSGAGIQGSAGIGFTDFKVTSPEGDVEFNRGQFIAVAIERAFVPHFYLTLTLSHMNSDGVANYDFTNLSSSTTYTATDVNFKAKMNDLGIGFKLKLIDGYWFRPYLEAGGLGGYHEVSYTSKQSVLQGQGNDYKSKDTIMGSGYYGEAGIEVAFSEKLGVKLSGRKSYYDTKELETLNNRSLRFETETYYFSALMGF